MIANSEIWKSLAAAATYLMLVHDARGASAAVAFDMLAKLQGQWSITSSSKVYPFPMTYDVGSKGSIVEEHFGKELSVFYRDGDGLLMTHFCNVGNQPRLRLTSGDARSLTFQIMDITNLSEKSDAHVHRVVYEFADDRTIRLQIIWQHGETESTEAYTLRRE